MNDIKNFNVPILLLIFNRVDKVNVLVESLRLVKPTRLFVCADGPRNKEELESCEKTRETISAIDWPCEVTTLFRENNLGCKNSVSQGISWFFDQVEYGIILEDDCIPNPSFFYFCNDLLFKYMDNDRVMHISATNLGSNSQLKEDYYFSSFPNIWGWATWKRAWNKYDVNMQAWPKYYKNKLYLNFFNDEKMSKNWLVEFQSTYDGKINTWDYQWFFCCLLNDGLAIMPKNNMAKNIGFDSSGTHTFSTTHKFSRLKVVDQTFPLVHQSIVLRNFELDYQMQKNIYNTSIKEKITQRLSRLIGN